MWEVARPHFLERRVDAGTIAALSDLRTFDDSLTVGQVAPMPKRNADGLLRSIAATHGQAQREVMAADAKLEVTHAREMADNFISRAISNLPASDMSPRELVVSICVAQGVDPAELRDARRLSDLSTLATLRSQLRFVAELTDLPFHRLRLVRMEQLPSWRIVQALRKHGQQRTKRPGSNVADGRLAVLAAYTDTLHVDKRTHEDFRRVRQKETDIASLIGDVTKARHYSDLAVEVAPGQRYRLRAQPRDVKPGGRAPSYCGPTRSPIAPHLKTQPVPTDTARRFIISLLQPIILVMLASDRWSYAHASRHAHVAISATPQPK